MFAFDNAVHMVDISCVQVESTLAMQNLQPKIKAIQERYAGNQVNAFPINEIITSAYSVV